MKSWAAKALEMNERLRRLDRDHDAIEGLLARLRTVRRDDDSAEFFELAVRINALEREVATKALALVEEIDALLATDAEN